MNTTGPYLGFLLCLCSMLIVRGASPEEQERLKLLTASLEKSSGQPSWIATLDTSSTVTNGTGDEAFVAVVIRQTGERRQSARAEGVAGVDSYLRVNQSIDGARGQAGARVSFGWVLEVSNLGIDTADDAWLRYSSVRPDLLAATLPLEWMKASEVEGIEPTLQTGFAALTRKFFDFDPAIFDEDEVLDVLELDVQKINGRDARLFWIRWRTETATTGALELPFLVPSDVPEVVPRNVADQKSSVSRYWIDADTNLAFKIEHRSTSPTSSGGEVEVERLFTFSDYNQTVDVPGPDGEQLAAGSP